MIARRYFPGDFQAEEAAAFHVHLDNMCSEDRFYKRRLEILADSFYRAKRKKGKKKVKSTKPEPKEVRDFRIFYQKTKLAQDLLIQINLLD